MRRRDVRTRKDFAFFLAALTYSIFFIVSSMKQSWSQSSAFSIANNFGEELLMDLSVSNKGTDGRQTEPGQLVDEPLSRLRKNDNNHRNKDSNLNTSIRHTVPQRWNESGITVPLPRRDATTSVSSNSSFYGATQLAPSAVKFKRYDGVVIVTKVLWDNDIQSVCDIICYLAHAYNDDMKYDIVVFTTIPWSVENIAKIQKIAAPAKVTVAVEGPPLEEQLAELSQEELSMLRKRCSLGDKPNETLTWQHYCKEEDSKHMVHLGYCWQAEFRAYHIWNHDALKPYKYMFWVDSDCRIGKKWDQDPMAMMIENDLTLLYSGWPYGKFKDPKTREKMKRVYNRTLCYSKQNENGELYGKMCEDGEGMPYLIRQVAGSHHITNLDHYRKDIHQTFLKSFVGDYRFSRKYDDQIAVTIVALMEQSLRKEGMKVWHERSKNLTLKLAHHRMFDVNKSDRTPAVREDFFDLVKREWPGLEERCGALFR